MKSLRIAAALATAGLMLVTTTAFGFTSDGTAPAATTKAKTVAGKTVAGKTVVRKTAAGKARKATVACDGADARPTQANLATIRSATLCLLNVERTSRGLHAMRGHTELAEAATGYAHSMVDQRFFAHVSPSGSTLVARIRKTSYLTRTAAWALGENLAWGQSQLSTPEHTVEAWMESAGHRRNILDGRFNEIGIGIAYGTPVGGQENGATYVTEFGSRNLQAKSAALRR